MDASNSFQAVNHRKVKGRETGSVFFFAFFAALILERTKRAVCPSPRNFFK